ncbi:hypothetical protein SASPL_120675 [Salvia splendens]|uniref:Uncharacterized protein n=1 Tax=Salvia splendens TaxID=180675 RepID=A0A8X8XVX7_SALSN|nr:hypothetical protein SASPL_120675 [Salvia splendens]
MARTNYSVLPNNNPLFTFNSRPSNSLFFFSNNYISLHSNYSLSSSNHLHLLTHSSSAPIPRVSTASVEHAPPPDLSFYQEIARLKRLSEFLSGCRTFTDKLRVIDSDSRVKSFLKSWRIRFAGVSLSDRELFLLKCVAAAGQEHVLADFESGEIQMGMTSLKSALYGLAEMIENWDGDGGVGSQRVGQEKRAALRSLLKMLGEVEHFYDCIGGIIGYQISVLELLAQSTQEGHTTHWNGQTAMSLRRQFVEIHPPSVLDLSENTEYASQAAFWGIEGLPDLGEIYPLGGSADRLGLVDPETGECLPAAMLPYCGRTLLEGLIRDLQPLVPTIAAEDGHWIVKRPLEPVCKPGGHGVIWKLAHDKGVFKWFRSHARKGVTVRQISNVVAATDVTLLALAGIGLHHRKART